MPDCSSCAYARWDYERYYGTTAKDWFFDGCAKDLEPAEDCEGYEEIENE